MGMSMGSGGGKPPTLAEINVTPFVDVMLVLLVIFMVTASVDSLRAERELDESESRVERDLVPRKPEPPKNVLKDVPVIVPNTNVKKIQQTQQKEPKVVLDKNLVFRLDATVVVDCKALSPELATLPRDGNNEAATALFEKCATKAAGILGPNALIQEKQRVNFACDRSIPWGWATQFMAVMGIQHGIKQVNVIAQGQQEAD
jgi:biopolymer transport protein ExbD